MESILAHRRRHGSWFTLAFLLFLVGSGLPQQAFEVPDFFIRVSAESRDLEGKIREARSEIIRQQRTPKFWVGYRFDYRNDLEFGNIYIHDEGWINFSRHDEDVYRQTDDLENHIWGALAELGDEEARRRVESRRDLRPDAIESWGLFLQFDTRTLEVQKVKLYHYRQRHVFDDYPVAWLGDLETSESFDYLTRMIQDRDHPADVVKPAIFVLSVHDHPDVVPFLKFIAAGEDDFETRKTAVFWLGQIPGDQSFDALTELYARAQNREMKEKLVFSISQHSSDRVVHLLERIARQDQDAEVRKKAIFWLGQVDDDESLRILRDLLASSRRRELKEKIVFSISQHKSPRAATILIDVAHHDPDLEVRKKAIFWLGQMAGRKTLKALGDIVHREAETELKTKAVFAISQHPDKELAVEMLIDVAQNNPNPEVREKAMFWLGQSGDARAVDFFRKVLTR